MPNPQFTIAFNLNTTNEDRQEIFGVGILLGPGSEPGRGMNNPLICEARFDDETQFRRAYDVLMKEGQNHSLEGPFPWATLLGLVTVKFGVGWALYYNEKMGE